MWGQQLAAWIDCWETDTSMRYGFQLSWHCLMPAVPNLKAPCRAPWPRGCHTSTTPAQQQSSSLQSWALSRRPAIKRQPACGRCSVCLGRRHRALCVAALVTPEHAAVTAQKLELWQVSLGSQMRCGAKGSPACLQGWVPGLHRQVLFTGIRLGLYERVKDVLSGGASETPLYAKVAAALSTSAVGITVANPADLVKVRLQVGLPRAKSCLWLCRWLRAISGLCLQDRAGTSNELRVAGQVHGGCGRRGAH